MFKKLFSRPPPGINARQALAAFLFLAASVFVPHAGADEVNYDDPNMAFTSDFVADRVSSCPATMKKAEREACLKRLVDSSPSDVALADPLVRLPAPKSADLNRPRKSSR